MGDDALRALAAAHGIQLGYHDIWGTYHEVSDASVHALLRAMDVDVSTPEAVRTQLDRRRARVWQRRLPPVIVVEHDTDVDVPVGVPASLRAQRWTWTVRLESGDVEHGEFEPTGLDVLDQAEIDSQAWQRLRLRLPIRPPLGYHSVTVHPASASARDPADNAETALIVAPARAWLPPVLADGRRVWGWATQLYALRSTCDWGIGDLSCLAGLIELAPGQGAAFVGLNPLHALFPHDPERASPYSPSSRLFLNPLYLDVTAVPEFADAEGGPHAPEPTALEARMRALRALDRVDYADVGVLKLETLARLYAHFRERHLDPETQRGRAFRHFQREGGVALRRHALFEALQAHFAARSENVWGWPDWPEPYRHPASPAVVQFADEHREDVEFYEYLQWLTEEQLARAGNRARALGMPIGMYRDLAVSVSPGGADAWADQELYAAGATVGAPPDDFNLEGQDWGLPPLVPERLIQRAYVPFVEMLRRNMRHAGALRIDHVMALRRLFWIPRGGTARDGAYVEYPFRDLLRIVVLESVRNQCLVIGEDLGTVPDEVRAALQPARVLSYRLFLFEREHDGAFRAPDRYPREALVAATTHDLPTLAGYWEGRDIDLRHRLGLFPTEDEYDRQRAARAEERRRILAALDHAALLPDDAIVDGEPALPMPPSLARAVHAFLARSPAQLMAVQPDDVLLLRDQVNLPGTSDAYPNWRMRLPLPVEAWTADARVAAHVALLREPRGAAGEA